MQTGSHLLWEPSPERVAAANMTRFTALVNQRHGLALDLYDALWEWSVGHIPDCWAALWDYLELRASVPYECVVDDLGRFPGAKWFPGARLNTAENLLRYRDAHTALVFRGEAGPAVRMSYEELYAAVAGVAGALRESGVRPGDRVAGYLPNLIETVVAMLATTAVGGVWASCATDTGPAVAADRLGQIEPVLLFACDGHRYKGRVFDTRANAAELARRLPSVRRVVMVHYAGGSDDRSSIPDAVGWDEFAATSAPDGLVCEQLPFSHPGVVMFSSGTTGRPKCLVQSGAGVVLNHLKELALHADIGRGDVVLYLTTAGWMMWNWLVSALGLGATVFLYDGSPVYPDTDALWRLVEEEGVTVFGTSAAYLTMLRRAGIAPGLGHDLGRVREICQTGSPLSAEGFAWVYEAVKEDVHFNSLSGGTDINGCFAIGSPTLPVYAGQLQARGLGMKVECYDEAGRPVRDREGELVCEAPTPSMPLFFWNDPDGRRYRDSYFDVYPGVWRHGDYVMIDSETGGLQFFGRSDAVLKPSGVRIGTAEIYNLVEELPEIEDSLAVGQEWEGDQRVILFLRPAEGHELTDDLREKVARRLREGASPRHVPALMFAVPDIPYTRNQKKVETAVTNLLHGRAVTNRDALANPESLAYFEALVPQLQRR